MTWVRWRALLLTFPLVLCLITRSQAQNSSALRDADSAQINQIVASFVDAYNHHDANTCAMYLAEDVDFINVAGIGTHGRKAVADRWPALFAGRMKEAHRTVSIRSVRFLSPEIAMVSSDWELTNSRVVDGGPLVPLRRGLYNWLMTKQDDRWLISIFHESDLPPAPPK